MKLFSNKKILTLFSAIVLFAFFGKIVFATPPASFYNPGETLNPGCLPTDPNCDVAPPLIATNISDVVFDATWNADTTHAPSKNAIFKEIQVLEIGAAASLGAFVQGGNSLGAPGTLGTLDNNSLNIITNGTPKVTVLAGGNVGIGTTSPVNKLEVYDSQNADAGLRVTNSSTGNVATALIRVENSTGSNGRLFKLGSGYGVYKTLAANDLGFYNAVSGNISILNDYASGKILFTAGAASTAQMVIDTTGNVGIGTTSPAYMLDVSGARARIYNQGGTNQTLLQVQNGSSQGGNNAFQIVANDGATNVFSIVGSGAVTATGDIHLTDGTNDRFTALANLSNAGASGGQDGGGFRFGKGGTFSGIGAGGGGYLGNERIINFFTGDDFTNEKMIIRANGNVGIGTTNPQYPLDVHGNVRFGSSNFNNLVAGQNGASTAFVGSETAGWGFGLTSDGGATFPMTFY